MARQPKKHTIITFATGDFYDSGLYLLKTWKKAADKLVVFAYEYRKKQGTRTRKHGAEIINVTAPDFREKIMLYKFVLIRNYLKSRLENGGAGEYISYLDYDTMVSKSWAHIYKSAFDVGFTVRPNARSRILNTNGGVIFIHCNKKSLEFFEWAVNFIEKSATGIRQPGLDQYYDIASLCKVDITKVRWWCDQLFTSAVCQHIYGTHGKDPLEDYKIFPFNQYSVGLFNCPIYNDTSEFTLENIKDPKYMDTRYIIHFKGRRKNRVYKPLLAELRKR